MTGTILLKHGVKHAAGLAAAVASPFTNRTRASACVLMYHRVTDTSILDFAVDNWNITPVRLEKQLQWLADGANCVPLADVLEVHPSDKKSKPVVALTFDDGFANFRLNVLPLLERYRVPATLFVVTGHVGSEEPYPFDQWGQENRHRVPLAAWRPITWAEIGDCLRSGLVSVGSHSHNHLNAINARDEQLQDEAVRSREVLNERIGDKPVCPYAYPYGSVRLGQVRAAYCDAVRSVGFTMAVTTDVGLATPTTPRFQVPRVEVNAYDSPRILRAKVLGGLWPQRLCDRLRRAQRYAR
jgi:peptidoglycan/xylan/chitin deacetylase (PgdA/CDA1 family)